MSKVSGPKTEGNLTLSEHVDRTDLFDDKTIAYDLAMRLLYSTGGIKQSGKMATVVDLRALLDGLSDSQLLNAIATQMSVPVQEFDENSVDVEIRSKAQQHYGRINRALSMSKEFITSELKFPLPRAVALTRVNSKTELLNLLRKVSAFQQGAKGLPSHLAYCALIKGAIATMELETHYASELEKEVAWLDSKIISPNEENDFTPLVIAKPFKIGDDEVEGVMSALEGAPCDVSFSMRDKRWKSIVKKYLVKPESNAKEAFKDEIAFRFKIDGTRPGSVARVIEYLHRHCAAEFSMIANKGVVGSQELAALFNSLKTINGAKGLQIDPDSNPKSAKGFAVLQLNGVLRVPPNGDTRVSKNEWRARAFEIQFVDTKRKPNTGLKSDAVYALKKDIIIATRFLGSINREWILEHAEQAALDPDTSMSAEDILRALEEDGFIFKKPKSRDKYAAADVWERWLEIPGLVNDEKIQATVRHALKMQIN